jgi:hypothetical protein
MAKKLETAADKYRRIKNELLGKEELFDVECPSGMVFKCRRPNLAQFVTSGVLPMSLAGKLKEAAEQGSPEEVFQSLEWQDQAKALEFSSKLVRYVCVSPKIVENPQPGKDEIGYDELELSDYTAIAQWATPGGGEAGSLETFR